MFMTVYQELQLNQAGSKKLIRSCTDKKEKRKHIAVYCLKIALTVAFCVVFVSIFTGIFGKENGVAGVGVLLALLAFRQVDLGFCPSQSAWVMLGIFGILAVGPHMANQVPSAAGFLINSISIFLMLLLGCHNVLYFNHATFVLTYLLLYGNDVSGIAYAKRVTGLMVGGLWVALCMYRNHRKAECKRSLKDVLKEFCLESTRSRWQIKMALGVCLSMLVGELVGLPRSMWIGIAAMSVLQPFDKDRKTKMIYRFLGTLAGCVGFMLLIRILPEESYGLLGIIGGIGVGFCATYKWQTVFNAFGALGIAMSLFGSGGSVTLRVINNGFAVLFVILFVPVVDWILDQFSIHSRRRMEVREK